MKTLKQLYTLLLKDFKTQPNYICHSMQDLFIKNLISEKEFNKLRTNFLKSKKTIPKYFTDHKTWKGTYSWWGGWETDSIKQRIKYIKYLINKYSK